LPPLVEPAVLPEPPLPAPPVPPAPLSGVSAMVPVITVALPVFGVIVKNERGDHVLVTNTLFDELRTGRFEPGDEVVYSTTFELLFADGLHVASPAVAYQDAQRFADWEEDAVSMIVRGDRFSGGIVDLPHETEVRRLAEPGFRPAQAHVSSGAE